MSKFVWRGEVSLNGLHQSFPLGTALLENLGLDNWNKSKLTCLTVARECADRVSLFNGKKI